MSTANISSGSFLTRSRWNPYMVGVGIGVLSWVVFAVVDDPLGITTALSAWAGLVAEPVIGAEGLKANAYWAKTMPAWNYGTLFVIGVFLGALVGSLSSRDFKVEVVPELWKSRFGGSKLLRLSVAFVGGALTMYGARMAGGCTSGHGVSGSLQLAVSGWTFFLTIFATGMITAFAMFGRSRAK